MVRRIYVQPHLQLSLIHILTTRDDTFTVRAYGELANREGVDVYKRQAPGPPKGESLVPSLERMLEMVIEMCIRDRPYPVRRWHDLRMDRQ